MKDSEQDKSSRQPDAVADSPHADEQTTRAQPLLPGLPTGTGLGKYRILERIRTYHHALVYKARDAMLDRLVTLKQMAPDLIDNPIACGNFKREAQFLARCSFDPRFIVNVFELIEDEAGLFIVEEYVDGSWLDSLVAKRKIGPKDAPRLLRTAGAGLKLLHGMSIVHRDIHPGNILLTPGGVAKIANLSCAAHESDVGRPPVVTPRYAAPELILENKYDDRVDVYSLGMTLYEVCIGRRALDQFISKTTGTGMTAVGRWIAWVVELNLPLPPAAAINPLVPPMLSDLIARMTAKRLDDRITSIDEAIESLSAATSSKPARTNSTAIPAITELIPATTPQPVHSNADVTPMNQPQARPVLTMQPPSMGTVAFLRPAPSVSQPPQPVRSAPSSTAFTKSQPVKPTARRTTAPEPATVSAQISPEAMKNRSGSATHRGRHRPRVISTPSRTMPRIERVPTAPEAHESFKKKYPRMIRSAFVAALMIGIATFGGHWAWQHHLLSVARTPTQVIYDLGEEAYRSGHFDESRVRFRELAGMRVVEADDVALQRAATGWVDLLDARKAMEKSDFEAVQSHLEAARDSGVESFRISDLQTQMWDKKDDERLVTEGMEALAREDFTAAERAFMLYEERVGNDEPDAGRLRETLEQAKRDYRYRKSLKDAKRSLIKDDFAVALGALGQAEAIRISSETRELRKEILDAKNRFEWILTGDEALMSRDFSQAVTAYERASEMAPSREVETKLKSARAHLFLEQAKQAIAAGDVLGSEDKLKSSLYNADTDEAKRQLERYAPAFEAARLVKRGDLAVSLNKFDEAEQLYRSAIPQLPEAARPPVQEKILNTRRAAAMDRGDKAFFRGDLDSAFAEYREAQRIRNGPDVEEKISRVQAQIP